jgi:lipopolysaccharide transport system ATP-binding protein
MSSKIAIKVERLSKCYQIYEKPRDRLKQFLFPRISNLIGVDPKKYFREFWALKDVSFEIKKGETVGIIGRNGSGKSTLLQIICGTLFPNNGRVETNGRIAALLELGSGFNPEFTGRENVYLNAAVLGMSRIEIEERFDDIASFADIGEFIEQPVKTYSSGMFVRLAFAIQANVDPDILIVDEALAVGDVFFVHRCMSRFHELKAKGTTILFVSHDSTAIKTLCDKAIWLKNGQQQVVGNACDVVDAYLRDEDKGMSYLNEIIASTKVVENEVKITEDSPLLKPTARDGNRKMVIEDAVLLNEEYIKVSQVTSGKPLSLGLTIKNNSIEPGTKLVVGYVLKNIRGIDISSSNNELEGFEIPAPKRGGKFQLEISFMLPFLHFGQYALTISLGSRDSSGGMEGYDIQENLLRFELLETKKCFVLMTFETSYRLPLANQ